MLMVSLGIAGPLVGMVACEDSSGGIELPVESAGNGGSHSPGGQG